MTLAAAADTFLRWSAPLAVQLGALAALALLARGAARATRRRLWAEVQTALWLTVPLAVLLPPGLGSPFRTAPASALGRSAWDAAGPGPPTWPLLAWLAGLALLATACGWTERRRARRWLADARPVPAGVRALARDAARRLGLRRLPPVCVSLRARGPAVVGLIRPTVVLPAGLLAPDARAGVEAVLLHELAHVRRRDPLRSLALTAVCLAAWWHPAVWLARRALVVQRELACDALAARHLAGGAAGYRGTLLELARPLADAPGLAFGASALFERLARLQSAPRIAAPVRAAGALLLASAASVACLPAASPAPPVIAPTAPLAAGAAPSEAVRLADRLPPLDELEGCLRLRYAVLALAEESRNRP
ncbi:MAG: M56 family metallopeptidase [Planctomycetota bacterium]